MFGRKRLQQTITARNPGRDRALFFPMLLKTLREEVLHANLELVRRGLVLYTFGNVSGIDRGEGLVAIKPSGVPYADLTPAHMVVSDLEGKIVDGTLRPIFRSAHSSRPLQMLLDHWRSGAHSFRIRHGVGAGGDFYPLLRDHACRLFSRPRPGHRTAQPGGDRGRIRIRDRRGHLPNVHTA